MFSFELLVDYLIALVQPLYFLNRLFMRSDNRFDALSLHLYHQILAKDHAAGCERIAEAGLVASDYSPVFGLLWRK